MDGPGRDPIGRTAGLNQGAETSFRESSLATLSQRRHFPATRNEAQACTSKPAPAATRSAKRDYR